MINSLAALKNLDIEKVAAAIEADAGESFGSDLRESLRQAKAGDMVRIKQGELPPLTEERLAELKALAERPESEIDYSDIAPLDDAFWQKAVPNPFYKPTKKPTPIR